MIDMKIDSNLSASFSPDMAAITERMSEMMLEEVQENFLTSGFGKWPPKKSGEPSRLIASGALYRSLRRTSGNDFAEVSGGDGIPYAAIHQFGGTTHPMVTAKSKKFFWHKYYETGNEMYKAMALSRIGDQFNVVIPERRWLELRKEFVNRMVKELSIKIVSIFKPK